MAKTINVKRYIVHVDEIHRKLNALQVNNSAACPVLSGRLSTELFCFCLHDRQPCPPRKNTARPGFDVPHRQNATPCLILAFFLYIYHCEPLVIDPTVLAHPRRSLFIQFAWCHLCLFCSFLLTCSLLTSVFRSPASVLRPQPGVLLPSFYPLFAVFSTFLTFLVSFSSFIHPPLCTSLCIFVRSSSI